MFNPQTAIRAFNAVLYYRFLSFVLIKCLLSVFNPQQLAIADQESNKFHSSKESKSK